MKRTRLVFLFPPSNVEEPLTYHLVKDYGLMVNILRAAIDPHKQGWMVVELSGEDYQLSQGLNYLERAGVRVEPLTQQIKQLEDRCVSCTACLPICPTGALDVNRESWAVSYDAEKCVVCLSCVDACPYNAIEISLQ